MDASPFTRSGLIRRSPPPTPDQRNTQESVRPIETVSTSDIQTWMSSIESCLNEVCSIASEGKLNSEQKLRINNLCRKVGHGTSQMAVLYQALKQKAIVADVSIQTLNEKQELTERLSEIKQTIQETFEKSQETNSFADIVKKSKNHFLRPNNFSSVAIYPNDKMKTSDETKTLVQKIICPEEMKLHVRGLRKTKNGGVIISTEKKDDIEKLKQSLHSSTSGLTVGEHTKRRPRITIIGVKSSLAENEVYKCMYEQNLTEKMPSLTRESFSSSIKLSHKSGKKDAETCNYVLEVTANIFKVLIAQERVYINWSSCPVREFTLVTRCFNCQQYGHAAKTCKEAKPTCGHCGELGHQITDCTKKSESPKCASCMRFKKQSSHKTGDTDCPAKKNAEQRYINSIDYEGA